MALRLILLVATMLAVPALHAQSPPVEPLEAYQAARARLSPLVYQVTIDVHYLGGEPTTAVAVPPNPDLRYSGRFTSTTQGIALRYEVRDASERVLELNEQVWDGRQLWTRTVPEAGSERCPSLFVHMPADGPGQILGGVASGGFLFGWITTGGVSDPVGLFRGQAGAVRTTGSDGATEFVLQGGRVGGMLRLSDTDPPALMAADLLSRVESPGRFRRFMDRIRGEVRVAAMHQQLFDVEVETRDGAALPVGGKLLVTRRDSNGDAVSTLYVARLEYEPAADGDVAEPFIPEEGTVVIAGTPPIPHVLVGGLLEPQLDRRLIEAAEAAHAAIHGAQPQPSALAAFALVEPGDASSSDGPATAGEAACDLGSARDNALASLVLLARLHAGAEAVQQLRRADVQPAGAERDDIVKSARALGLQAEPLARLTLQALKASPYPLLLSVRHAEYDRRYQGWALFLGFEEDAALLFTAEHGLHRLPLAQLQGNWNGVAVAVNTGPISIWTLRRAEWAAYVPPFVGALLLVALLAALRRRRGRVPWSVGPRFASGVADFAAFVVIAGVAGAIWHAAAPQGLIRLREAGAPILHALAGQRAPKIDVDDIARLTGEGYRLIDVRDSLSFHSGHLPGAHNIPITLTAGELDRALAEIPTDARLILYCSRSTCHMAENFAARLASRGYGDFVVFPGGWEEWLMQTKNGGTPS